MNRWIYVLVYWWLCLPAWARLGGGSRYRSSSRSSSRSSGSSWGSSSSGRSSSSSSWGWSSGSSSSSSHSYSSGSSYHSSGGSGHGGFFDFIEGLFTLCLIGLGLVVLFYVLMRFHKSLNAQMVFVGMAGWIILAVTHPWLLGFLALLGVMFAGKYEWDNLDLLGGIQRFFAGDGSAGTRIRNFTDGGSGGPNYDVEISQPRPLVYSQLLKQDPNFSLPIFREFAVLLYCQAMQEMPGGKFSHTVPYLSPGAAKQLTQRGAPFEKVRDIVVGSFQLKNVSAGYNRSVMRVFFESNYVVEKEGRLQGYIAEETWTFERKAGVLSKEPKAVATLNCPCCGYGGEFPSNGVCPQCSSTNIKAEFGWQVTNIQVIFTEEFEPNLVEGGGIEEGTDLPVKVHFELGRRKEDFMTRHPDFNWDAFWDKASQIFLKLQEGWTERDASKCRPHETDLLYRTHRYWIEEYQRKGKINKLSDIKIDRWILSNVISDAYYESITGRVYASMIDVTTDENGRVLSGNPNKPRVFTEYWTFIRRIGHKEAKGDSVTSCPSCGAPLDKINQAGQCEYCETVVTLGDFDWVLTNIEQDEVYDVI
ncbi:MAG TPA: Tim44 domain-containing protein [Phycisphaerales bacterium]|nr:Tim44 domain-containing protein [Phycisphaerales bacterium]